MWVELDVWDVHIGSYKHNTEKELELLSENQKKFVCDYFRESYEVLGIDANKKVA